MERGEERECGWKEEREGVRMEREGFRINNSQSLKVGHLPECSSLDRSQLIVLQLSGEKPQNVLPSVDKLIYT